MLFTRRIKHVAFMNRDFRKYGWYALGEIGLIIIGILIALQIDTWYEDRKTQANLQLYLEGIAEDIAGDITRLERLRDTRLRIALEARAAVFSLGPVDYLDSWFDEATVRKTSPLIGRSLAQFYFVANSGTYRSLENSGLVNELNDSALKGLLHDYYRTVDRIANTERDLNNLLRELSMAFDAEAPDDLPLFFLQEPLLLWGDDTQSPDPERLRRRYGEVLASGVTQSLLMSAAHQPLYQEYEQLLTLGRALVEKIAGGGAPHSGAGTAIYTPDSDQGFPVIFQKGLPALHSLGVFTSPSCPPEARCFGVEDGVALAEDALVLDYRGGQPWAFFYAYIGPIDIHTERYGKDFSAFDRVQLELRSEGACPAFEFVLKDVDDPDDGSERRVALQPAPDWTTYTIDLDEFTTADLTQLTVVAGFLFGEEACRMAVREVRYLLPGEEA